MIAAPESCPCCGSAKLSKLGEDITETLEVIPRQWKVIQTVREKFSCRDCETITQPPAPFHVTPRGFAGPNLLAMILFEKFGQHQPLNRQSERYAREGIDLSVSTLADQVGACTTVAAAAACADRGACAGGRAAARRRHHGADPGEGQDGHGPHLDLCPRRPALRRPRAAGGALLRLARPAAASIPTGIFDDFTGILQADAYSGYNELYEPSRAPGPITSALCWAHARRQFFELADIAANARRGKKAPAISPVALEAVKRIDALFDIERGINGLTAEERLRVRQEQSAPLVDDSGSLAARASGPACRARPPSPSRSTTCSSAGTGFTRFLDDGRICLTNNAAERALRGFALGRKSWLFAGSDRGADRAAVMATLIMTAKLNDVDPQAWLADVLARIADTAAEPAS